jgi:hypothetical protein
MDIESFSPPSAKPSNVEVVREKAKSTVLECVVGLLVGKEWSAYLEKVEFSSKVI